MTLLAGLLPGSVTTTSAGLAILAVVSMGARLPTVAGFWSHSEEGGSAPSACPAIAAREVTPFGQPPSGYQLGRYSAADVAPWLEVREEAVDFG